MREFHAYLDTSEWPRTAQGTIRADEGLRHLTEFARRYAQLSLLLDPAPSDPWSPTGPWLIETAAAQGARGDWNLAQSCQQILGELERMRARVEGAADVLDLLEVEDDPGVTNLGRLRRTSEALTALADRWREVADPDLSEEARVAVLAGKAPDETPAPGL